MDRLDDLPADLRQAVAHARREHPEGAVRIELSRTMRSSSPVAVTTDGHTREYDSLDE